MKSYTSPVLVDSGDIQGVSINGEHANAAFHARIKDTPENIAACNGPRAFLSFLLLSKAYKNENRIDLPAGRLNVRGDGGRQILNLKHPSILAQCEDPYNGGIGVVLEIIPSEVWEADPTCNLPALYIQTDEPVEEGCYALPGFPTDEYLFGLDGQFWNEDGEPVEVDLNQRGVPKFPFQLSGTESVQAYYDAMCSYEEGKSIAERLKPKLAKLYAAQQQIALGLQHEPSL